MPADVYDAGDVDGIDARLPRLERNGAEGQLFFVKREKGRQHDIRQIVIVLESIDVFGDDVRFHQSERRIGVGDFHAEIDSQKETNDFLDEVSGFPVASDISVSEDGVVFFSQLPKGIELRRIGLPVGIGLENIIGALFGGVAIQGNQFRPVLLSGIR